MQPEIEGFLTEPKRTAGGSPRKGRLTLPDVQWTGVADEAFATITLTIEEIADAAESNLIWTDQSVQRGIVPSADAATPRELSVGDGYPDSRYVFDAANADRIVEKLLYGERLFLNPLVWNLRPREFEAYWDDDSAEISLFSGKVHLPDSHHRHQAIVKAVRSYREHPSSFPKFSLDRQFKVELYFLDREDEGNYFFDKNQRPKPTALSKAYDLTTQDDLSTLAKRVLDRSPNLDSGVNRVTDRVSKSAPHFMTLSTLREMMRIFAGTDEVEETELDGLASIAADFLGLLTDVRPELRTSTPHSQRDSSLASSGVMMLAYAGLLRDYSNDLTKTGSVAGKRLWKERLAKLAPVNVYKQGTWSGDYMDRDNPLWVDLGITKPNPDTGKLTIVNTGGSRSQATRALRARVEQ